jgi:hypothetical protein
MSFIANAAVTPIISMAYFYLTFSYSLFLWAFLGGYSTLIHVTACASLQKRIEELKKWEDKNPKWG